MRKLLLAAVAVIGLSVPVNAATIQDFGLDPTSAGGAFNHSLGALTGLFDDQYTFHLDHVATLTIASVTNVFAQNSDFITGFHGSVFAGTPALPGAQVIGPVAATSPCGFITLCQGFAGSAILAAGDYFLDIGGFANGTSGYGGNLATFATAETPIPATIWLFASGIGGVAALARRKRKAAAQAAA